MFSNGTIKKLVLILLAIMLICFGIAAFIFIENGDSFNNVISNDKSGGVLNSYEVNDEKILPLDDIEQIEASTASTDVEFILEDRKDVKINLYGTVKTTNEDCVPYLSAEIKGDNLVIKEKHKTTMVTIMNSDLKLDIHLPKSYKNNVKADVSSADIFIDGYSLKDLDLSSASGDFTIKNITCDTLKVDQSSGSSIANNIKCKEFSFKSASGTLNGTFIETDKSNLKSSSGKINIDEFTGDVISESASGDITLKFKEFKNNIDINTASGDVTIALPDSAEFYLNANVASGKISCKFPIIIESSSDKRSLSGTVKNADNKIKIGTASGDIEIK